MKDPLKLLVDVGGVQLLLLDPAGTSPLCDVSFLSMWPSGLAGRPHKPKADQLTKTLAASETPGSGCRS